MSESDYRKATFDQCIASFPEDARGLRYLTWDGVRLMAPERRKSLAYCHPIPSAECRLLVLFKELNGRGLLLRLQLENNFLRLCLFQSLLRLSLTLDLATSPPAL